MNYDHFSEGGEYDLKYPGTDRVKVDRDILLKQTVYMSWESRHIVGLQLCIPCKSRHSMYLDKVDTF